MAFDADGHCRRECVVCASEAQYMLPSVVSARVMSCVRNTGREKRVRERERFLLHE